MKLKFLASLMLSAFVAIVSCKGDKGELGPEGPQGPAGTAGVKYSNWIKVSDANWTEVERDFQAGGDSVLTYKTEIPTPEVTQEVLDKGTVLYYFKDSSALGNGSVKHLDLQLASFEGFYQAGVTNRTKADYESDYSDYAKFYLNTGSDTIPKQKLVLNTYWQGGAQFWNSSYWESDYQPLKVKYEELKPKTKFYVRYVIIPAGTLTGGRRAPVDVKNYEAVKKYYHIKD